MPALAVRRLPHPALTRRRLLTSLGSSLLAPGLALSAPAAALERIGETRLPHRMAFAGTTVGGLSAIDHDPASGLYWLLSDDRSDLQPARLYRMRLQLSGSELRAELVDVLTLRQQDGQPWPDKHEAGPHDEVPDPESLRLLPGGGFAWSSEGDAAHGFGASIHVCAADGRQQRTLALPAYFAPGPGRGTRDNLGLEGLALTPDGTRLWAAMEAPLLQDGPIPTVRAAGGACRFTLFDLATGEPRRQIAYRPEPIPQAPLVQGLPADNGVSEILALDDHRLLVLERSYAVGRGNTLRLFGIDTRGAPDVLARDTLPPDLPAVAKTLVADFATLGLQRLDNTEGMCWGPDLPDGRRCLVVVSDDNFNPVQATQIVLFAFRDNT